MKYKKLFDMLGSKRMSKADAKELYHGFLKIK